MRKQEEGGRDLGDREERRTAAFEKK